MFSNWPNSPAWCNMKPALPIARVVRKVQGTPQLVSDPIFLHRLIQFIRLYVNLDAGPITNCITGPVRQGFQTIEIFMFIWQVKDNLFSIFCFNSSTVLLTDYSIYLSTIYFSDLATIYFLYLLTVQVLYWSQFNCRDLIFITERWICTRNTFFFSFCTRDVWLCKTGLIISNVGKIYSRCLFKIFEFLSRIWSRVLLWSVILAVEPCVMTMATFSK